jgi:hypothetical protein
VGIWKLVSYSREDVETGKKVDLYGQHPGGYNSFSPNGHFIGVLVAENQIHPAGEIITDQERIELFKSIISAYSGTYIIENDKIVIAVDFSWNQWWTGTKLVRNFKIEGKQLKVWNPPRKSTLDGRAFISTSIFEKVE